MLECILNSDVPVPSEVSSYIYNHASQMVFKRQRSRRLRSDICEGVLKTDGTYSSFGSISGMKFTADVSFGAHHSVIIFLLRVANREPVERDWKDGTLAEIEALVRQEEMAAIPPRSKMH